MAYGGLRWLTVAYGGLGGLRWLKVAWLKVA